MQKHSQTSHCLLFIGLLFCVCRTFSFCWNYVRQCVHQISMRTKCQKCLLDFFCCCIACRNVEMCTLYSVYTGDFAINLHAYYVRLNLWMAKLNNAILLNDLHRERKKIQFSFFDSLFFFFLLFLRFLCLEKFTEKLSSNKSAWGQNELIHWYMVQ